MPDGPALTPVERGECPFCESSVGDDKPDVKTHIQNDRPAFSRQSPFNLAPEDLPAPFGGGG